MTETKIQKNKRIIAHKRRKHEEKELMKTYNALTKDYNDQFDFEITNQTVNAKSRKINTGYTLANDIPVRQTKYNKKF